MRLKELNYRQVFRMCILKEDSALKIWKIVKFNNFEVISLLQAPFAKKNIIKTLILVILEAKMWFLQIVLFCGFLEHFEEKGPNTHTPHFVLPRKEYKLSDKFAVPIPF